MNEPEAPAAVVQPHLASPVVTLGDIVAYHPRKEDRSGANEDKHPWPAIVVHVWPGDLGVVTLMVFLPFTTMIASNTLRLVGVSWSPEAGPGTWTLRT